MDVEAVGKRDRRAVLQVVVDMGVVGLGLELVGHRHHDQVGPGGGLGDVLHRQALGLDLGRTCRARTQRDAEVFRPAVTQVQRMRVALAAIADDGHVLVLDQVDVAVAIIIDAHGALVPLLAFAGVCAVSFLGRG